MTLNHSLAQLQSNELVHAVAHEDQTCIFKTALTQQAAYNSLLLKQRRQLHRHVAQAYEEIYADRLEAYAGILAYHYAQAGEDAKTVHYALSAGDEASRTYANAEANEFYQKALAALEHLPLDDQRRRQHIDTLIKQVSVAYSIQASDLSFEYLRQAETLTQELCARDNLHQDRLRLARIHYWLGRMHVYRNQTAQAIDALMRVLDEAGDADDAALLAYPSAIIGRMMNIQGQFGAAGVLLNQAIQPIDRSGNVPEWIFTIGHLGLSLAARGHYLEGLAHGRQAAQRAIEINNAVSIAEAHVLLAAIYYMGGDYAQMRDAANRCLQTAEPSATRLYVFTAYASRALASSFLGDHSAALASITRAQDIGKTMSENRAYSDWVASAHAQILLHAGDIDSAIDAAQHAVELAQTVGGIFALGLAERVWALALARRNARWDEIETHLANSLNAFDVGEACLEAARTHFVWGELSAQCQRIDAAHEHWQHAAEQFRASGLQHELARVRQILPQ
jgi:predicted ATPase